MKRFFLLSVAILISLGLFLSAASAQIQQGNQGKDGEKTYLVGFKNEAKGLEKIKDKGQVSRQYKHLPVAAVKMTPGKAKELENDPDIQFVEPDGAVKTEEAFPWNITEIGADMAQNQSVTGQGIKIAVLDTGIDTSHEDLRVAGGASFVENSSGSQDAELPPEGAGSYMDDNGHGTQVAGIIAALGSGGGVTGVAPGAGLYSVKVLDKDGTGTYSQVIAGIDWSIDHGMKIVNMSLGGDQDSQALELAMQKASDSGILLVAAAGNGGEIQYPAKYPTVIAVGAVDQNEQRATFSSTGPELEIMAPGVDIESTLPGNKYGTMSGTSAAAPHVAGAAALIWSARPGLTGAQVREILKENTLPLGDPSEYGAGLVNLAGVFGGQPQQENIQPASEEIIKINYYLRENKGMARVAAVSSLSSDDPAVREYAAKVLGEIGEIDELPSLDALAQKDPQESVRAQASLSAAQIYMRNTGDENKKLSLLGDLLKSDLPLPRDYAICQLSGMSGDGARELAGEALATEMDPAEKSVLEAVYTQSGSPDLSTLSYSGNPEESIVKILSYNYQGNGQTITAGERATVSLNVFSAHSEVEVKVYKNSSPNTIIASRNYYNVPADGAVSYTWYTSTSTAPGTYTIWYHYPDNSNSSWDDYFTIYVEAAPPPEPYDQYEPNNSTSNATNIQLGGYYTAYIGRAYDVDYYRFTPTSSGRLSFNMTGPSNVDFDAELLNSGGGHLTGGCGSSSNESFSYDVTGGCTYYILIDGYGGYYSSSPYHFSTSLQPKINDIYEPNNSRSSATSIDLNRSYTAYIDYAGDNDYYRFIPAYTGDLTFSMTGPLGRDYDVQLQNSSGGVIAKSSNYNCSENFTCSVTAGNTYYICIYGNNSSYDSSNSYSFSTQLTRAALTVMGIAVPAQINPGQEFAVEAQIKNTSNVTANNVKIEIDPQSGLSLSGGSAQISLGQLGAGAEANEKWILTASATPPCQRAVTVKTWADNAGQNSLQSAAINIVQAPITGTAATEKIVKTFNGEINSIFSEGCVYCPVNTANGAYVLAKTLITVNGAQPIEFIAHYNSLLLHQGTMGTGWGNNFEARVQAEANGDVDIYWDNSRKNTYTNNNGVYTPADLENKFDTLVKNPDGSYTLTRQDQSVYIFNTAGKLAELKNGHGQSLTMAYDGSGRLASITEPVSGQSITFTYGPSGRMAAIADKTGRRVSINYDSAGNLAGITDPDGKTTTYTYNSEGQLLTVTGPDGVTQITNTYDEQGRVATQDDAVAGNQSIRFNYDETSQPGKVIVTVTGRDGQTRVFTHNDKYQLLSIKDELGNTVAYTYDDKGDRITTTDAASRTSSFTYDDRGNLLTVTDPAGHKTTMTYDSRNNLLTVENAAGKKVSFQYDANNNPIKITDPLGNTTVLTYDANGLLQTRTDPGAGTTSYSYKNGLLSSVTGPENNTVSYSYDGAGRLTGITDGAGNTSSIEYDSDGNLTKIKDPLGDTVSYTYDSRGNRLTATDARGSTTSYGYNANGKLTSVTDALGDRTTYEYDGEDRLIKVVDARGNATGMGYDAKGRLISVTDPLGHTTTYQYNAVDSLVGQKDAMSRQILSIGYDVVNNPVTVTDALGRTVTSQYDILNRLTSVSDPLGRSTQFGYDDLNRLTAAADAQGGQARQTFDVAGNRKTLTDPNNNQTTFSYDKAGRIVASTPASGGTVHYGYNAQSLLSQVTNGRGQTARYQYDSAGRITGIAYPEGTVSYTYDANGNVLTVTGSDGTSTRQYDALNRVKSYTDSRGNTLQYNYDKVGNLITLTYPGGKQVHYDYDAANRLTRVTDWAGRVTAYEYDANNRLVRTARPDGTAQTMSYDAAGQLLQQKDVDSSGGIIVEYDYTYDGAGNISTEQETGGAAPKTADSATMSYAPDNRLSACNGKPVVYDADGNVVSGPLGGKTTSFVYDSGNLLLSAGDTTYRYDAEGNRISITEGGKQTDYIVNPNAPLSQVLIKTDDQGNKTFYVYGLGLLGQENADGTYDTYHYDLRGSTVALTDGSGKVTDCFASTPYGQLAAHDGKASTPFLFCGEYGVMTDGNGLCYMRARYYSPEMGRFISRDSYEGVLTNDLSLNSYSYVMGNPLIFVDLSGHFAQGDILQKGARGEDVIMLQTRLNQLGYFNGKIDGILGNITLAAVNSYKNSMGLGNSGAYYGKVGAQTWTWLGLDFTKPMQASSKLIDFIAQYESFKPTIYRGADVQNQTIGYGHVICSGENFNNGLSQEQAKELLEKDVQRDVNAVNRLTSGNNLTQQQFDALVDFAYNCGIHGFGKSTLLKDIQSGNVTNNKLYADFTAWCLCNNQRLLGLWRRRVDEWQMYTEGDYVRDYPDW